MKPMKTVVALVGAVMCLNGCVTAHQWHKHPYKQTTVTHHSIAQDDIVAFGVVKQQNSQLEEGSLVMMGKKYWFVVAAKDSKALDDILNTKLRRAFLITEHYPERIYQAFPVLIQAADSNRFSSDFCLRYDNPMPSEREKLQALAFKEIKYTEKTVYQRCMTASGSFYTKPVAAKADYRFEQSFPVDIGYVEKTNKINRVQLAVNILMSPIALATDAAMSVVVVGAGIVAAPLAVALAPAKLIGSAAKKNKKQPEHTPN